MAASSKTAVFSAVIANFFLTVVKFVAFFLSGSGAMFSEAVHSAADAGNQLLLFLGIRSSERPADATFHYGYGGDRYLYSLLSAVGIFVFGCGITIYHAIHGLLHPVHVEPSLLGYGVLALSFFVDGFVLVSALRVVWVQKGERGLFEFLRTTSDPTIAAVLLEDSVATSGVLVAGLAILLTQLTGDPMYDSIGALIVGFMLGFIAIWLAIKNRRLLLGPKIPDHIHEGVMDYLRAHPAIRRIREPKSRIVGAGQYRFAAEIDFDGGWFGRKQAAFVGERASALTSETEREAFASEMGERIVDAVATEIDVIEDELRKRFPELLHVDIEAD
ncbi:cation diffusion facilitator family transporter [Nannocystaceae bacterium ST9]